MYANPPTWNFPVQACDSNYITLKHIQITDTLVAKFRKVPNATPQHGTFKTPGQASPSPSNFGDTSKYLCSMSQKPRCSRMCRTWTFLAGEYARSRLKVTQISSKQNVQSSDGSPPKNPRTLSRFALKIAGTVTLLSEKLHCLEHIHVA